LAQGRGRGRGGGRTTRVRGWAAARAAMSASWSPESASDDRSIPSLDGSAANTTATSAAAAAATASASSVGSGGCQPKCSAAPPIEDPVAYSLVIGTGAPLVRSTSVCTVTGFAPGLALPPVQNSVPPRATSAPSRYSRAIPEVVRLNR